MSAIAVINSDESLNRSIESICRGFNDESFVPFFLRTTEKAKVSLDYDLPQLAIINLVDNVINIDEILRTIRDDPWLHSCGIVAIHNEASEAGLYDTFKNINLIALISNDLIDEKFPRVLKILQKHKQMVFHSNIQDLLSNQITCNYELGNDPFEAHIYANIVENFLFNSNLLAPELRGSISLILSELLMNAIEHGNCNITFNEKSEWMNSGKTIFDLILSRRLAPEVINKKVLFNYTISADKTVFTIIDEGEGFDHEKFTGSKEVVHDLELHGRGILLANACTETLRYNEKGNECSFEINHVKNQNNTIPFIFMESKPVSYNDKDIIFKENESSDDLYYIVSGKFNIICQDKKISQLNNDDIFLGEMSFLLNNTRSATVVADGPAKLIKISKKVFVNSIKNNPHYGIFLARLLAQRLSRTSVGH